MTEKDLFISGETIQRLYGYYNSRRLIANRRYQRKLVWSIDEKIAFINSLIDRYPVPLILLAQKQQEGRSYFEIIDGLQRLNAIMSFVEGEFKVSDGYFDLNTIADTKEQLDLGVLSQKEPILDRSICTSLAGYPLPVSVYGFFRNEDIDEIFRRINSNGRYLSPQELRSAGALGAFATAVRSLSSIVRGDVSASDEIVLNEIKKISITNRELLSYGIDVDDIFWVANNILTKDMVRQSRDEEIVADMVAHMCLDDMQPSRKEALDEYYGFEEGGRTIDVENAVKKIGQEVISLKFIATLDEIKNVLAESGKRFSELLFGDQEVQRIPRYFEVIFMAMYDLMHRENLEVADRRQLVATLKRARQHIEVGSGGGTWSAQNKEANVAAVKGLLRAHFVSRKQTDPAYAVWSTQLETILRQSYTEQALYDFKQGVCSLDGSGRFDEQGWIGVLQTLVGIANYAPNAVGYVLLGIVDKPADALRIRDLYGLDSFVFDEFHICGIEADCRALDRNADKYFAFVVDKLRHSRLSEELKDHISRRIRLVRYHERSVLVMESKGQESPSHLDGIYFERHGSSTLTVDPKSFNRLFSRFLAR